MYKITFILNPDINQKKGSIDFVEMKLNLPFVPQIGSKITINEEYESIVITTIDYIVEEDRFIACTNLCTN